MDTSSSNLHCELSTRLSSPCSPNELLGYMTAILFYSKYSSTLTLESINDLDGVIIHLKLWMKKPGMGKLGLLCLHIVKRIRGLNCPIVFKTTSVLDHASALLDTAVDESDFYFAVPSEN